jgi:beta-aspartyl-dipeptidase (metallo-type)
VILLVENGEVFAPEPRGRASVLCLDRRIAVVGEVDRAAVEAVGVDVEVVDARGCWVVPGILDGHQHLLGGSGECGFDTRSPEITLTELLEAGVTTVVGCLGLDNRTRNLSALLARAKGLREYGLACLLYTGGYTTPPAQLVGSVRDDIMFIDQIIGLGELAIADRRSTQPTAHELARVVTDAATGGMLAGKCGVTHFHVGDGPMRLKLLRELLDEHDIDPRWLYPTHVQRTPELLREAVDLSKRGVHVDMDTVDRDARDKVKEFIDAGGDLDRLTLSSDASVTTPSTLIDAVRELVRARTLPVERALRLVTTTPARALGLRSKGALAPRMDADLLALDQRTLELRYVIASGRALVDPRGPRVREKYLEESDRVVRATGAKARTKGP